MFRSSSRSSIALAAFLLASGSIAKAEWKFGDGVNLCNGSHKSLFLRMNKKPLGPVGWTRQTRPGALLEVEEFTVEAPFSGDAPEGSFMELEPGESIRILGDDIMKWFLGANFVVRTANGTLVSQLYFEQQRLFRPPYRYDDYHWSFMLYTPGLADEWMVAPRENKLEPVILYRNGSRPELKPEGKGWAPEADAGLALPGEDRQRVVAGQEAPGGRGLEAKEARADAPLPAPPMGAPGRPPLVAALPAPANRNEENKGPAGQAVMVAQGAGVRQPAHHQAQAGGHARLTKGQKKRLREKRKAQAARAQRQAEANAQDVQRRP